MQRQTVLQPFWIGSTKSFLSMGGLVSHSPPRFVCRDVASRDTLCVLEYIVDAADAARHLTPAIIMRTVEKLENLLGSKCSSNNRAEAPGASLFQCVSKRGHHLAPHQYLSSLLLLCADRGIAAIGRPRSDNLLQGYRTIPLAMPYKQRYLRTSHLFSDKASAITFSQVHTHDQTRPDRESSSA